MLQAVTKVLEFPKKYETTPISYTNLEHESESKTTPTVHANLSMDLKS